MFTALKGHFHGYFAVFWSNCSNIYQKKTKFANLKLLFRVDWEENTLRDFSKQELAIISF